MYRFLIHGCYILLSIPYITWKILFYWKYYIKMLLLYLRIKGYMTETMKKQQFLIRRELIQAKYVFSEKDWTNNFSGILKNINKNVNIS